MCTETVRCGYKDNVLSITMDFWVRDVSDEEYESEEEPFDIVNSMKHHPMLRRLPSAFEARKRLAKLKGCTFRTVRSLFVSVAYPESAKNNVSDNVCNNDVNVCVGDQKKGQDPC